MTPTGPDVVVIGESIVDVVRTEDGSRESAGGSPANVATGLARMGVDTRLFTRIGADDHGALLTDHFRSAGVRLEELPAADRTSTAVATVTGDRSASYEFDIAWSLPDGLRLGNPALIHTGSIASFLEPGATSVRDLLDLRADGALVSYDPNIRPAIIGDRRSAWPSFETLARASDIVKLSAEDAAWLYRDLPPTRVLERILELGPRIAVVTDGGVGAHLATSSDVVFVPSFEVAVVDTIGAGDTYMASLIETSLSLKRWELNVDELRSMGRRAAAAAALCVMKPGAQPPTLAEIDDFLTSAV